MSLYRYVVARLVDRCLARCVEDDRESRARLSSLYTEFCTTLDY